MAELPANTMDPKQIPPLDKDLRPTPGGLLLPGMKTLSPLHMPWWKRIIIFTSVLVIAAGVACLIVLRSNIDRFTNGNKSPAHIGWVPDYKAVAATVDYPPACSGILPADFGWGFSASAWQNEGSTTADGKGITIWDAWASQGGIKREYGDPNITAGFYKHHTADIGLMKNMGARQFRFSISWARILPQGKANSTLNPAGVAFYNTVIDELIAQGITPVVTLHHFDTPADLEPGMVTEGLRMSTGFLDAGIIDDFVFYAEQCFRLFGDRVKHWITFNEPANYCEFGYEFGWWPPGYKGYNSQLCMHNVVLAHAKAYDKYDAFYRNVNGSGPGQIGIVHSVYWAQPYRRNNPDDLEAANVKMETSLAWWLDPFLEGRYINETMWIKKLSASEILQVSGRLDFVGINYYTARWYSWDSKNKTMVVDRAADANNYLIGEQLEPDWLFNAPWGLQLTLQYIKNRYQQKMKPIWITESGTASESTTDNLQQDSRRVQFYKDHLQYMCKAMTEDGIPVKSFLAWTLTDNFEWGYGTTKRFGVFRVDFQDPDLPRLRKASADWLKLFFQQALP